MQGQPQIGQFRAPSNKRPQSKNRTQHVQPISIN